MHRLKHSRRDDPRVRKTQAFLGMYFPEMSSGRAALYSRSLVEATEQSEVLYHRGAKDRDALKAFIKNLMRAKFEIDKVSEWIETGLATSKRGSALDRCTCHPLTAPDELVSAKDEFHHMVDEWIAIAQATDNMRQGWRPPHGVNEKAILLIDEARAVWRSLTESEPPLRSINGESKTRFKVYLAGVFDAVGVHADLPNAYKAWAKLAHELNPILRPPVGW